MKNTNRKAFQPANDPITSAVNKYRAARSNLLLAAVFTTINILLLLAKDFTYFLFSAAIPYLIADLGMYICGKYPEEFYIDGYEGAEFFNDTVFYVLLAIAFVIIAFYVLCYVFSSKGRVGWLIAALVAFSLDTLVMFSQYNLASSIIDIIFHVYVIVFLVLGIKAHFDLKKIEKAEEESASEGKEGYAFESLNEDSAEDEERREIPDSTPLRTADFSVKSRVFLEANVFSHKVIYRRVKRVNELIIDGDVYAEYKALVEFSHILTAVKDGHEIAAGIDSSSRMVIMVDGNVVARKIRII